MKILLHFSKFLPNFAGDIVIKISTNTKTSYHQFNWQIL